VVADLRGGEKVGNVFRPDMSEAEVMAALRMDATVKKALAQDGLVDWLQPDINP
jgi:hypothetical protein